jgi:hypothetical protein
MSGIRAIQCADNLKEGGLTGTTGTDDTYDLSLFDAQVDTFQHLQ